MRVISHQPEGDKKRSEGMRLTHFQGGARQAKQEAEPVIFLPRRKSTMSKAVQKPVVNQSEIPPEFVAMASYGAKNGTKRIKGSPEYTILAKAWKDKKLGGIKLVRTVNDNRGNIFVNKVEADELIASRLTSPKSLKEKSLEGCTAPKHTTGLSSLMSELLATNEKMIVLMAQLQSAIRAEQDNDNLTLFN